MLRSISSAHAKSCITLLLWAHILGMAIARKVVVDDSETDQIIYSNGWIDHDFPDCHDCPHGYALPLLNAHNGTWHRPRLLNTSLYGRLDFNFKFNGTGVEVRFIADCPNSDSDSMPVYSIDEGGVVKTDYNCPGPGFIYDQTLFSVRGLSNKEHILKVAPAIPFLFDYLIYETEGPNGTLLADTSNAPRSQGVIIGGAVSAVVLLVFGITLFLFLKRRRRAGLGETVAPYVEDTSFGVTAPGLRNFTGRPKRYSLNTITSVANQPVEAGLMSLEVNGPK